METPEADPSIESHKVTILRKTLFYVALTIILPVLSFAGQFKVTRVYDGDTVKAVRHDIEIRVRLIGIDAPERLKRKRDPRQPYNQRVTKQLAAMILDKTVDIKGYGSDQYSRILGVIFWNGNNVNLEMVKLGLAEVYRGKPPRGFDIAAYKQAEEEARKAGRGMWSQGNKYISPKDWRKMPAGNSKSDFIKGVLHISI